MCVLRREIRPILYRVLNKAYTIKPTIGVGLICKGWPLWTSKLSNKFTHQYEFFDELLSVKILCRLCHSEGIRICESEKKGF